MNEMVNIAYNAIDEKQGADTLIFKISEISPLADYFIITNGNNNPQIDAIVENIDFEMSKKGYEPLSIEGVKKGGWTLLDYGDIVIHVFGKDEREYYDLERLWVDAEKISL